MSRVARIVLVRHGQASAISGDYDQLSDLGVEQSRLLAGYFERFDLRPDRVLVGPRKRHAQTHEAARLSHWIAPERIDALDEHHAVELLVALGPALGQRDDELGRLAREAFTPDHGPRESPAERTGRDQVGPASLGTPGDSMRKALSRVFAAIIPAWARGEVVHPDVEPFDAFQARIAGFVEEMRQSEGTTIAFTSGGAISAAVAAVHGLSIDQLLDVMWHVKNASITEIAARDGRMTIAALNHTPHLLEPRLISGV